MLCVLVSLSMLLRGAARSRCLKTGGVADSQPGVRSSRGSEGSALPKDESASARRMQLLTASRPRADFAGQARMFENYGRLPLSFEANQGQTDRRVKFLARGSGYTLFLTTDEAVLVLREVETEATSKRSNLDLGVANFDRTQKLKPRAEVLRMRLAGANCGAKASGLEELPGKSNYFIGRGPKNWRTNVPNYAKVQYKGIYPGIDLVYYGNQRQLEYDFVVAAGADPRAIQLRIEGAEELRIERDGALVIAIAGGELRLHKPLAYQRRTDGPAAKHFVPARFVLSGKHQVGFEVASYDSRQPLVIDPKMDYSTYLGGSALDEGLGIALDSSGNAYVAGITVSSNFPTTQGAFETAGCCGFVTKLNAAGSVLLYSTYLNGAVSFGIAADPGGNAYVTGGANANFVATSGAFQTTFGGGQFDAFVAKLNPQGSGLVYASFLGGTGNDLGSSIAVDGAGNAYVTGATLSPNFPVTRGAFDTRCGSDGTCNAGFSDAFLTQVNAAGSALLYSTFLGGSLIDAGRGVAVDAFGKVYVTGSTTSGDFPTTSGAFQTTFGGGADAFVAKIDPSQLGKASLLYSTFLGGTNIDISSSIAIDTLGNAYVTGATSSTDFPTLNPWQAANAGGKDAFVTKLNAHGSALVYSTYLGGAGDDSGNSISLDGTGAAYIVGQTYSSNFPTKSPVQSTNAGNGDAFLAKFSRTASALQFSTYLGGAGLEQGFGIAVDHCGMAYLAGQTVSSNFPTTGGAFQASSAGGSDAFVAKVPASPRVALSATFLVFPPQPVGTTSAPKTVNVLNTGAAPLTITSISTSGDFQQTNNCGASLPGGATCSINVTFTPTAGGARSGTLTIKDDALCGPHTVALFGFGTSP